MAEEFDVLSDNRALVRSVPPNGEDKTATATATDFNSQVQQYGQQAADALNKAKGYAQEYLGTAGDKLKDLQGKDFGQIADDAKDYARRNPVQAVGIAAAVGLVVGLILRRR